MSSHRSLDKTSNRDRSSLTEENETKEEAGVLSSTALSPSSQIVFPAIDSPFSSNHSPLTGDRIIIGYNSVSPGTSETDEKTEIPSGTSKNNEDISVPSSESIEETGILLFNILMDFGDSKTSIVQPRVLI